MSKSSNPALPFDTGLGGALDFDTAPRPIGGYEALFIREGSGVFEVDFKAYSHRGERILFLGPGQYFRVLSGSLSVEEIDLPATLIRDRCDPGSASRVLFTHVYEVGAIWPTSSSGRKPPRDQADGIRSWLGSAVRDWYEQKPLHHAISRRETDLIFDLQQLIESRYRERRPVDDYVRDLGFSSKWINRITTSYVSRTVGELVNSRRVLEAKRELVFTDKTAAEIAYELDFSDPAYFSRFFLNKTGMSPSAFRTEHSEWRVDPFLERLWLLIEDHFREFRQVDFYAGLLHETPKSLSEKVRRLSGQPLGRLIHERVAAEARHLLTTTGLPVQEIAWYLGFEEASHFSRFFKQKVGLAPAIWRRQN